MKKNGWGDLSRKCSLCNGLTESIQDVTDENPNMQRDIFEIIMQCEEMRNFGKTARMVTASTPYGKSYQHGSCPAEEKGEKPIGVLGRNLRLLGRRIFG